MSPKFSRTSQPWDRLAVFDLYGLARPPEFNPHSLRLHVRLVQWVACTPSGRIRKAWSTISSMVNPHG
jgi:hypothetical protein